jgi:hypothetical protein
MIAFMTKLFSFFIEGFLCNKDFIVRQEHLVNGAYKTSNKSEDFYKKLKKYYRSDWFMNQTASWNGNFKPVFIESLTTRGYGFTFNLLNASKLYTNK